MANKNTMPGSLIESEKLLDDKLVKVVESLGGWCLKMGTTHISGLPDRVCLLPRGRVFFAEIKTTKKKPRKIQIWVHNKLKGLGFEVYVIDRTEQIKELTAIYGL